MNLVKKASSLMPPMKLYLEEQPPTQSFQLVAFYISSKYVSLLESMTPGRF